MRPSLGSPSSTAAAAAEVVGNNSSRQPTNRRHMARIGSQLFLIPDMFSSDDSVAVVVVYWRAGQ